MGDILNFPLLIAALQNEEERLENNQRKKNLRNTSDPLDLPEIVFKSVYRFNKDTARYLIDEIGPFIPDPERNELKIPKSQIILCALHFYAQGTYQKSTGQDMNCPMSQSSVSRCIDMVTDILNEHFGYKVKFPQNDGEKNEEKIKFFNIFDAFPGIIGVVDGTHVRIVAPPTNDQIFPAILFYNRKGFYSLNVQIICSADYRILAVNPRYPGSVHDSAIWSTSLPRLHLMQAFRYGDRSSWLLGDSGYPLEPWLITPVIGDMNEQERRFNILFRRIRNIIERVIGILKSRFRCCFGHRALHYAPMKAAKIVNACAILHNILLERQDILEENPEADAPIPDEPINFHDLNIGQNYFNEGVHTRNRIINNYL